MVDLREGLETTLGPGYTVERELSGGGMSRVFVAYDVTLGRRVVVKVLPAELAASVSVERFKREIMLAATLQHPHIVGVLSAGEIAPVGPDGPEGRLPYFTMPFVEGESLRARLQREGHLPVGRAVSILKDVARALAYAHEHGVIHRDIKPDNVLLAGGSATVTDFGIAKALLGAITNEATRTPGGSTVSAATTAKSGLTQLGTTLGTPAYMAPEQAAADPNTDHRADIYSFGIMAYEMLTGQVPFKSATPQALLAAQLTAAPPPIPSRRTDVPVALAALVMACLEKDPPRRPQSAREIAEMLEHPDMVSGAYAVAPQPTGRQRRSAKLAIGSTIALLVLVLAYVVIGRQRAAVIAAAAAIARDSANAAAAERARSIVVLPFVNIGRDSSDDYIADGLTNDLINALAKESGLRVTSRSAARTARERNMSSAEIGEALNAGRVLEGTVQRAGNRLRVTARVSSTDDGFMLWSDMFERELRDVFAVQDEISTSIASVLSGVTRDSTVATVAERGTRDDVAYDAYLRGWHLMEQGGGGAVRRALVLFRQSTSRDPRFARGHAGTAAAYRLLGQASPAAADASFRAGFAAATRAIQLDSSLTEAYAYRGSLLGSQWRWREAERDFRKAIARDSNFAPAHQWYGEQLLVQNRAPSAIEELKRAKEIDPLSPAIASSYAMALLVIRHDIEAIVTGRNAKELDSSSALPRLVIGADHLAGSRPSEAVRELEPALGLGRDLYLQGLLGFAYARNGQTLNATAMAKELSRDQSPDAVAAMGLIQLGRGDTAIALTNLEKAANAHAPFFMVYPLALSLYDPVRRSARFQGLLQTLGLHPFCFARTMRFCHS